MRTRSLLSVSIAGLLLHPVAASAYHDEAIAHSCPLSPTKAQYHFAADFTPPLDAETQTKEFQKSPDQGGCGGEPWRLAGFGGAPFEPVPGMSIPASCQPAATPVIFVHGNVVDAGDWYPVLPVFAEAGYSMCELWGLSYNGVGSNSGGALYTHNARAGEERGDAGNSSRITNNGLNVADLERFITAVLRYTKARRFSIVAHSLGVTLARRTLKDNPQLLARVETFVGIAGGNHGTTLCRGNEALLASRSGRWLMSCNELAPDLPPVYENEWLTELNKGDETPRPAHYMTIYDGSGVTDIAFLGPDRDSPRLKGAMNCSFPGAYHNDLRVDPAIASVYVAFVAGEPLPDVRPGASPATPLGGHCEKP